MQNFKPQLLVVALLGIGLASCAALETSTVISAAIPNDNADDYPALQAEIDRLGKAGGGVLQLESGTYDLSQPLYLRSYVTLNGRGPDTILTNERLNRKKGWAGTTVYSGSLAPASFTYNNGVGYPGLPAKRMGTHKIELGECKTQNAPVVRTGQVVWIASSKSFVGRGNFDRPDEGEMNLVEKLDGCTVTLADPVTIKPETPMRLYWADGTIAVHKGLEPNVPVRNVTLSNLQIRAGREAALLSTGCYACTITDVRIGKTRRLLAVQGPRNSVYRRITGEFGERGIEIAMFSNGNVIEDISGKYVPRSDLTPRPAIRFGEYPRNNVLRNIDLNLGLAYRAVTLIRFDESSDNSLEKVRLRLAGGASATKVKSGRKSDFLYKTPKDSIGKEGVMAPGTTMRDVQVCKDGDNCREAR